MQETYVRDEGSIPGSERCPGGGHGNPLTSILTWRMPWAEEPGGLQSIESQRVGQTEMTQHRWVLCRMPLDLGCFLSHDQFGIMALEEDNHKSKALSLSHPIKGTGQHHDFLMITRFTWCLPDSLLSSHFLSLSRLFQKRVTVQDMLKRRANKFHFLDGGLSKIMQTYVKTSTIINNYLGGDI